MQSTDRTEFEEQLKILCAAYDKPLGERAEAYWKGLAKMSLIEFARVVEFAISEDGPERLPDTHTCWNIRKRLKAGPAMPQPAFVDRRGEGPDNLVFFANRLMLRHMLDRGGIGLPELQACLKVKSELVKEFIGYVRERDELATQGEFVRVFVSSINSISKIAKPDSWRKMLADPKAQTLFPPYMVDGLQAQGMFGFDR